jgi:hypothetical protein
MDATNINALITGAFATVVAIISVGGTIYISKRKVESKYADIKKYKRDAINGRWKGFFEQRLKDELITYQFNLEFTVSKSGSISGKVNLPYKDEIFYIDITGGFYSESFLKMDYQNSNKEITQFGAFVLKIADDCRKLEGYYVGYGHKTGTITAGHSVIEKI